MKLKSIGVSPNPVSAPARVTKVRRADLPGISSVVQGGAQHDLGLLQDFSWHALLSGSFLSHLSFSWVRLEKGQQLSVHQHPTPSAVIVCKGEVRSLGQLQDSLTEGDILLIPENTPHGFIGAGSDGFWGLSIQPAQNGIYTDPSKPRVEFLAADSWVTELVAANEAYLQAFHSNPLFALFASGQLDHAAEMDRFLALFQIWSDCFQDLLQIRVAAGSTSQLGLLALEHQKQEAGHNQQIRSARGGDCVSAFDPVAESYCSWFRERMRNASELEQAVLMHVVIEASADIFYSRLRAAKSNPALSNHIADHLQHDVEHYEMGIRALREVTPSTTDQTSEIQKQGWAVLNSLFTYFSNTLQK